MNRLCSPLRPTRVALPLFAAVFLWPGSSLGETSKSSQAAVDSWLAKARQTASADARALTKIELSAEYQYFTGTGDREVKDRTELEFPSTLYQERWVNGEHIRRGFAEGQAFVETETGRMALGEEFNQELESYVCRRRLEFLSFCDGFVLELKNEETSAELSVMAGEELFARLHFDLQSAQLKVIELPQSEMPELDVSEPTDVRLEFSDFRLVEGWNLAHHVEMWAEDRKIYHFNITAATLTRADH